MAKRFSVVVINDDDEVFVRGHVQPEICNSSSAVMGCLAKVPQTKKCNVKILHCMLLDFPGNDEDISVENLKQLMDVYDDLVEDEYIELVDLLEFKQPGLMAGKGGLFGRFKRS